MHTHKHNNTKPNKCTPRAIYMGLLNEHWRDFNNTMLNIKIKPIWRNENMYSLNPSPMNDISICFPLNGPNFMEVCFVPRYSRNWVEYFRVSLTKQIAHIFQIIFK